MEFVDKSLEPVRDRVLSGRRLTVDDVCLLYASPDLAAIGWMANQVKEKRWGRQVFYAINRKIEPTNICALTCRFCDFAVKNNDREAYAMTIDEIVEKCAGVREIHITGALHPEWKFDYYLQMVRSLRERYPDAGIKAFTAVEIEWFARISRLPVRQVLIKLKEVGLNALPGGGAEIFSERVRKELFPFKIGASTWLEVHRAAHELGIPTNATMLYGHIETPEERWAHLELLRKLQDETQGFMSFIPLAFQPGRTSKSLLPSGGEGGDEGWGDGQESPHPCPLPASGARGVVEDMKLLAISRLFLDNFPHIKAYWVTLGEETTSIALHFGADDVDGTIGEERIMHAAGAQSPAGLARERLEKLIREAGSTPCERDALYRDVHIRLDKVGQGWTKPCPT
jgi:aminodeoxyfutalosine synthase